MEDRFHIAAALGLCALALNFVGMLASIAIGIVVYVYARKVEARKVFSAPKPENDE
jgi:hypothetical protein